MNSIYGLFKLGFDFVSFIWSLVLVFVNICVLYRLRYLVLVIFWLEVMLKIEVFLYKKVEKLCNSMLVDSIEMFKVKFM